MDKLKLMSSFIAVAEEGTYTAAARRLGKTKALVSIHIDKLEALLSVRLISRTTRSLRLTDSGSVYYEEAKRVIDDIASLEANLRQEHQALTGRLRLSAPTTFGEVVLMPFVARLSLLHPHLIPDITLSDRYVDLVAEGFDLAIRVGQLKDSNLIARPVGQVELKVCVSPSFIQQYGTPSEPSQLSQLPCVVDRNFRQSGMWQFSETEQIKVMEKASVNNAMAAARMAVVGSVASLSPDFAVDEYIADGRLIQIFEHYKLAPLPIHVVYPHRQHLSSKVTVLTEALIDQLS